MEKPVFSQATDAIAEFVDAWDELEAELEARAFYNHE